MSAKTFKPSIPQVPPQSDRTLHSFLGAIKEQTEIGQGTRGNGGDRYITINMLLNAGIITSTQAELLRGM